MRRKDMQPQAHHSWEVEPVAQQQQWDCESVLSLTSNLDNHPGLLREPGPPRNARRRQQIAVPAEELIKLSEKTGLPVGYTGRLGPGRIGPGCPAFEDASTGDGPTSVPEGRSAAPMRRKDESLEEKRDRKQSVKEAKARLTLICL